MKGLIKGLSSEEYHGHKGSISSSQLKDLLEDPEVFYRKYITKEIEKKTISAFDVGTVFHTQVLEPEKATTDFAVFSGIRRGKEWDAFKEANKGKAIVTETEYTQAMGLVKAVQGSPIAMNRISKGDPEVSCFTDLIISGGEIFSGDGKLFLEKGGWEYSKGRKLGKVKTELKIKVRADLLGGNSILDLKSTSGNAKSESSMRKKISEYNYDLSASLYLDIFTLESGKIYDEFVWTFASKDYFNCQSYIASRNNILIGRAKYKKALITLANCMQTEWQLNDSMKILEPSFWELEWIEEKGEDLL